MPVRALHVFVYAAFVAGGAYWIVMNPKSGEMPEGVPLKQLRRARISEDHDEL